MAKTFRQFGFPVLGGLLVGLAYPSVFNFGPLLFAGLVIILWSVHTRSFWQGYVAGLAYFAITFRSFWLTYPLSSLGIKSVWLALVLIGLPYIISVLVMAVAWGIWSSYRRRGILVTAALFVLLEYLRSIAFGLLWYGSGTLLGPHWTMANPVYALSSGSLARALVPYLGSYGLLFLSVLASAWLASNLRTKSHRYSVAAILILASLLYLPSPLARPGKKLSYAIVQTVETDYSPANRLAHFKQQLAALNQISHAQPDTNLVIFPESSGFFTELATFLNSQQAKNYFKNLFSHPALLISGAQVVEKNQLLSRLFFLDSQQDIVGYYDKRLLFPFSEFLPQSLRFTLALVVPQFLSGLNPAHGSSIGARPAIAQSFHEQFRFVAIICSELLSPNLVRQASHDTDIILATASTAVFHGNPHIVAENLAIARLRAAENGKPLLLAANQGLSYVLDSHGNIEQIAPNQAAQILTGQVGISQTRTWYNKLGDWPILLLSFFILAGTVKQRKNVITT